MHCGLKYRERTQSVVSHSVTSKIHRFKMKKTINSPSWHNKMSFFLWEKKITSWKMPIQWKCHLDILKKILFCVWQRKKKRDLDEICIFWWTIPLISEKKTAAVRKPALLWCWNLLLMIYYFQFAYAPLNIQWWCCESVPSIELQAGTVPQLQR